MSCLFGYYGEPSDGLLDRMAELLGHRCIKGFEKTKISIGSDCVAEIGHGIAKWSGKSQVFADQNQHLAFGYAGVFFNTEMSNDLLANLSSRPEILESFEGAFAAAMAHGNTLTLIRDCAGIKVIYWTQCKNRLLFASEVKALFADPNVSRKLRIGALPEYFTFSFIPGERTMFEDIFELQPGTVLQFRNNTVALRRYFEFELQETDENRMLSEQEYVRQMQEKLEISVAECCQVQDAAPGVFLSGGIDSSSVLAHTARRFPDTRIRTFSVHFGEGYANENEFVSMMTNRYHTDHTWVRIQPSKFVRRMKDIIWNLDEPIGDPITVPNYLLSETASQVCNVILNGEGGDPCFGGPKNIAMMMAHLYGPLPQDSQESWIERNYLLTYRKCFSDLEQILSPDVLKASGGEQALTDILRPFFTADMPKKFLNKLMAINMRLKGANLILVKVEKMSSANGLLALPPLFSKRMIEMSMICPPQMKLAGNIEKAILKHAVEGIVPEPIIKRPKSGMMVPVKFWFREELRRYAQNMLSKKNLKKLGYFNASYIRNLLEYDNSEVQSSRYGLKLWMLITFMLWHDQMMGNFSNNMKPENKFPMPGYFSDLI